MTWIVILFELLILLAIAMVYHKLSSIMAKKEQSAIKMLENQFHQLEALNALYVELDLRYALPATRGWAASPDFLRSIMAHALSSRPGTIVECSSGVSTVVLARCMEKLGGGHVYSLEHDPLYAKKTRAALKHHGLGDYATVLDAPLDELKLPTWSGRWYRDVLPQDVAVDLIVIDGPPENTNRLARYPAVPILHDRLNKGAVIYLDDADRPDEREAERRWLTEFPGLSKLEVSPCEKGCVALSKVED